MHRHEPTPVLDSEDLRWLTDDEVSRYESITSAKRKWQFLAGHYLVRAMAARRYGNSHADWIYFVDEHNQRHLKCRQTEVPELHVSLSHTGEWIAAAISDYPVGIDIESCVKQRDFIAIARHVFSVTELTPLKLLASDELKRQFYLLWTLKECVAKQYGAGLKFEVSRSHASIPVDEPASASIISWQCPDYVLAVAVNPATDVETFGLCEHINTRYWLNISAISPLTD